MEPGGGAGAVLNLIRTVAQTESTNADLLNLAARGAADEGIWLRAERQLAGRGRQGRAWQSPPGNFHGSTIVRLRPADPAAASLSLVAGVALHECVAAYVTQAQADPDRLLLKWPNDLLMSGAKLAGILLERTGDAVIVGIGVNLAHHPDLADRPTTSLAAQGAAVDPPAFADTLADAFTRWLARWRGEGLAVVRAAWLSRAHAVGAALRLHATDGGVIEGLFDGLASDGALCLRDAAGTRHVIHAADVFML